MSFSDSESNQPASGLQADMDPEELAQYQLDDLYEAFGSKAVFLVLPYGVKGFESQEWQKITFKATQTEAYRQKLIWAIVLGGNIAVRLGPLSDGLRSVDVDCKDRVDQFGELNPKLANSVRVFGKKGCQFFFRCQTWASNNGESAVTKLKCADDDYGEFRFGETGGAYSMIFGQHPDDPAVRWEIEGDKLASLDGRSDITLPDDVHEVNSEKPAKGSYDDVEPGETTPLKAALEKLSIADVWRLLGVKGEPPPRDKLVRSPFREDKKPSFSIYADGKKWKDHGTGEHGDAADFLAKAAKNLSKSEACRELIRLAESPPQPSPSPNNDGQGDDNESGWEDPKPISYELLPVAKMLPEMLPEPLRAWLVDEAERMQCPLDFLAASAICGLSGLIGAGCGIRPKQLDNWTVVPNLWGGLIGRPGSKKTPAMNAVLRPIRELEKVSGEIFKVQETRHKADMMEFKARQKALESKIEAAATWEPSEDPEIRRCRTGHRGTQGRIRKTQTAARSDMAAVHDAERHD